jgi:cation transport regulator ChaC
MSGEIAVFAYGSLVAADSVARTLGRAGVDPVPARLIGWRREWSLTRDNRTCEKTFSRLDGSIPEVVLALNLAPEPGAEVNGALIAVDEEGLARLDLRENRYDRIDVTSAVVNNSGPAAVAVATYVAKPGHLAPEEPPGAVVLSTYERTVEAAFDELGPDELDRFRETTRPCGAERIEPVLVADAIPPGNPRDW